MFAFQYILHIEKRIDPSAVGRDTNPLVIRNGPYAKSLLVHVTISCQQSGLESGGSNRGFFLGSCVCETASELAVAVVQPMT